MTTLKTCVYRVNSILKKTRAEHFKNVEVGDFIEISFTLTNYCHYRSYVHQCDVANLLKGTTFKYSLNTVQSMLDKFELEEVGLTSSNVVKLTSDVAMNSSGFIQLHGLLAWNDFYCDEAFVPVFFEINGKTWFTVDDYKRYLQCTTLSLK